jgi:dihydrofolate reductase
VATARDAAGERNVLVLGADIAGQCLRAGHVDDVLILMVPVLLGDGVRLFGGLAPSDRLTLVDASRSGQVVSLRYRAAE